MESSASRPPMSARLDQGSGGHRSVPCLLTRAECRRTKSHHSASTAGRCSNAREVYPVLRRGRRHLKLALAATAAAGMYPESKEVYSPNATDKEILRMNPNRRLMPMDVINCFGYHRNLHEKYTLEEKIGHGSFGVVNRVVDIESGVSYACKTIPKVSRHHGYTTPHNLLKIRAEVDSMHQLGASLDAVFLKGVFEDRKYIHMVMELCTGGALLEGSENTAYSEMEAARIMRSVLRFLSQCHAKGLIYRDVKPENFLFTDTTESRTLKATDFGLTAKWDETRDPPMTSASGTPVYLAPEVCKCSYGNKADVYSAGVMCFQLLTGRYPYWSSMDFRAPSLHQLLEIIKVSEIDLSQEEGLSDLALDFLGCLLQKCPAQRPTAAEALEHPWVKDPSTGGQAQPGRLGGTIVQRLQHFAVSSRLKQLVLAMITDDLLKNSGGFSEGTDSSGDIGSQDAILADLRELYDQIQDGSTEEITQEDVFEELTDEGYFISAAEARQLVSRMDTDDDGAISLEEFVTCLLDWNAVQRGPQWDRMVAWAFSRLDMNGDGVLSVEEIANALVKEGGTMDYITEKAKLMVREIDSNNDGEVSWEEFYEMLSRGNDSTAFDSRLASPSSTSTIDDTEALPPR